MTAKEKSCYDCQHFLLCRVRDKATDLISYQNTTGVYLTLEFGEKLHKLMGSLCSKYKKEANK